MKSLSQGGSYGHSSLSQGSSSMYTYQGRVSVSRGQSVCVVEVFS